MSDNLEKDVTELHGEEKRHPFNLLVDAKYQLRFVALLTLQGVLLAGLFTLLFYAYMRESYLSLMDLASLPDEAKDILLIQLRQAMLGMALLATLFAALLSGFGLLVSHRTAGPIRQFRKVFMEIRQGKTSSRVQLRSSDHFREMADEFNEMMDTILKEER